MFRKTPRPQRAMVIRGTGPPLFPTLPLGGSRPLRFGKEKRNQRSNNAAGEETMASEEWGLLLKGRVASTAIRLLGAMAISTVLTASARASNVKYNPAPTTSTGWQQCGVKYYASLKNDFCATTAFFEPMSLTTEFESYPGRISVIFGLRSTLGTPATTNRTIRLRPPGRVGC